VIDAYSLFYSEETEFDFSGYDYVVDAIDTVKSKVSLIVNAKASGVPVISCMGAGNKLDPTAFEVADIYSTSVCPLARAMRTELKKKNITDLKVVYSKETPTVHGDITESKGVTGRPAPASISFVPSVAGLIIAGEVIKDLIK
ncbi:MAG: tRNA threonylcarbamoyladenosine dehydratase, partial [Clostridia bacterium]|nr:tRNA threonylcarbamoyladenosine dehydratase [Clostridia bacterium]